VSFADLPIRPVIMPADLVGQPNGKLPDRILTPVAGGRLHHAAAWAWNALVAAAAVDGVQLYPVSTYRTYDQQVALFTARYTTTYLAGQPSKLWNGQRWYKRYGVATAATPGTSNHGRGLAIDAGVRHNGVTVSITRDPDGTGPLRPGIEWLRANALRFGFSWELVPEEPWHIRYVAGDQTPGAVLAHELPASEPVVAAPAAWVPGIDVSKWQGTMNWPLTVNRGVKFTFIRAFNGIARDDRVEQNAAGAKAAGLPFGLYTYFRPGVDATQQANVLVAEHRRLGATLLPVVDVETADGLAPAEVAKRVRKMVDTVAAAIGRKPVIYTAAWFWNPQVRDGSFGDCLLWASRYPSSSQPPADPALWAEWALAKSQPVPPVGWSRWDIWQFSADGNGRGAYYGAQSSSLDLNVCSAEVFSKLQVTAAVTLPSVSIQSFDDAAKFVLRKGSGGRGASTAEKAAVKWVQVLTKKAGFNPGVVDGIFGTGTHNAVVAFQRRHRLLADGVVGPKTWAALRGYL
jgi:GH25 family lysozyme M1 (1,4-beta-N-acetylmuramidase)